MHPLVNILVPTFEPKPGHLREALDSLCAQSFQDWSVLIHDDASSVDVRSIVEPYLRDPRFRFERSATHLGIGGNWNACLRSLMTPKNPKNPTSPRKENHSSGSLGSSRSEPAFGSEESSGSERDGPSGPTADSSESSHRPESFIQFLFQDDTWHPSYLERSFAVLRGHPDIGFTAAHHAYASDDASSLKQYNWVQRFKAESLKKGRYEGVLFLQWWMDEGLRPNVIGEPSFVMLRQRTVEETGLFHETMVQGLDTEYWVRALLRTNWYYIEETFGTFRVHREAATARHAAEGLGLSDRLRCLEFLWKNLPGGEPRDRAREAIIRELGGMAKKFLLRRAEGERVRGAMAQALSFCARHPVLSVGGMMRSMLARREEEQ